MDRHVYYLDVRDERKGLQLMSNGLYNALFGVNPFSKILLDMIKIDRMNVPRFRDCYISLDGPRKIIIYTRTGGGNRETYEEPNEHNQDGPFNSDLRESPYYERDEDDGFDSTYAYFWYRVPDEHRESVDLLARMGSIRDPNSAWKDLLDKLQKGATTPETQKAMVLGEALMQQIKDMLK